MNPQTLVSIAPRVERIKASPTSVMNKHLRALRDSGRDIVSLNIGEPDFPTPAHIGRAAIEAIEAGDTKYTNVDGTVALKTAVRAKLERENGLQYNPEEIIVSTGAKQVIFEAIMATVTDGDEVVIPSPCWVSYPDIVALAGGTPRVVPAGLDFRLPIEAMRHAINTSTRWIIINNPCNPTGVCYSRTELLDLAELMRAHPKVMLLEDDIYEHVVYDGHAFHTLPQVAPDLQDRVLVVNGVSKAYSMTGWRIGYGAGHSRLIAAMVKLQSQATSCASSIGQAAATAALTGSFDCVASMRAAFEARRNLVAGALARISGIDFIQPQGTFYFFVGCEPLIGRRTRGGRQIEDDQALAVHLLDHGVAVVPGAAFLASPFFRISFATAEANLVQGCHRIATAVAELQ